VKKISIGYYIIASAIIWGVVIIACAVTLAGTPQVVTVNWILAVASAAHLLFIWGPLAGAIGKAKKEARE